MDFLSILRSVIFVIGSIVALAKVTQPETIVPQTNFLNGNDSFPSDASRFFTLAATVNGSPQIICDGIIVSQICIILHLSYVTFTRTVWLTLRKKRPANH